MNRKLILALAFLSSAAIADQAPRSLHFDANSQPGFTQMQPASIGIDFPGAKARQTLDRTLYVENGGAAAGDIDGDGFADLFLCGLSGESKLYSNRGDWNFADATANLRGALNGKYINAAALADVDGDGDLDLFCGSLFSHDTLLLNDGRGRFTPSDQIAWQTSPIGGTTSFALADIDLDGDLDLYVSRYLNTVARDRLSEKDLNQSFEPDIEKIRSGEAPSPAFAERFSVRYDTVNGAQIFSVDENGLHDILYLNDGHGRFTPSTNRFHDESGAALENLPEDWGLTASFRDVDQDGDPDLYVCNDFSSPDRFWINDGAGHYHPVAPLAIRRTSNSSMGIDFADINRDGHLDFFIVDMLSRSHTLRKRQMGEMVAAKTSIGEIANRPQIMQNTLFLNRGDQTWTEIAQFAGVKASEWSWSPVFLDIDLDGFDDIVVTTGAIRDFTDADVISEIKRQGYQTPDSYIARQKLYPRLPMRNFLFRNRGDLTFQDIGSQWGFNESNVSGGIALADFDNDGDLDLAINNTESPPEIYRNNAAADRIAIRLEGPQGNPNAIGARLALIQNGKASGIQEVTSGGSYASGSDSLRAFASSEIAADSHLEITWPDGKQSRIDSLESNRLYTISHAGAQNRRAKSEPNLNPIFEDVSHLLSHVHQEAEFDDFARQPLLPNRLSQLGPGVTWVDIDGDGYDELLVPSGRGKKLTLLANLKAERFKLIKSIDAPVDQTTVLAQPSGNGDTSFLLGLSNHEGENATPVLPFTFQNGAGWKLGTAFAPGEESIGALAQADIDGDGDLDLFVAGRAIPGQYPKAASSRIYLNQNGNLKLDATFDQLGLVSSAAFGDLDNDGDADLVLACEWGPIRVFANQNGTFVEETEKRGLADQTGWWNGVALGDLNNDGQLDIVATNWGRNSKYEGSYGKTKGPLQIYYGDVDGNGVEDIIEAHYDSQMECLVPERGFSCSSRAMPFIRPKLKTFEAFGLASLESIYGDHLSKTKKLEANTLEHKLFLGSGERFVPQSLPIESQFSPAFGVCIGDMDGDGNDDVFLAQNFFAVQIETPRNDGGRGLLLKGDGKGNLYPVPGHISGIKVYGDQRGAALSDFDKDGRVDLAIAQNGAETKLYRNAVAKPGLRVQLKGLPENPAGIGALVRLNFESHQGPTRIISSGSGYWSQESSTQVFGLPALPRSITVQWPDGEQATYPIPSDKAGTLSIQIHQTGQLNFNR